MKVDQCLRMAYPKMEMASLTTSTSSGYRPTHLERLSYTKRKL